MNVEPRDPNHPMLGTGCIIDDRWGRPVYFHAPPGLAFGPGQRVTYEVVDGPDGVLYAVNLRVEDAVGPLGDD